jgi:hypothetical protein
VQVKAIDAEQFGQICKQLLDAARAKLSPEDFERVRDAWAAIAVQMVQEE